MKITWDEHKRLSNRAKHGFDFLDVTPEFLKSCILIPAENKRMMAIGILGGRSVAVIFKPLGLEGLSIVSMRSASQKERGLL